MNEIFSAIAPPEAMLPDFPAWRALSDPTARDLLSGATIIDLMRNQAIDASVGVVLSGALAVRRGLSDGRIILTHLFYEGEIADRRRDARVCQGELIAVRPSTFLAFDETQYNAIAKRRRELTDLVMAQLREQAARMCDHATDLACKTPVERVASALFEFRRWPLTDQGGAVHIPLQRADLADYLGIQPETVSRAFRQLEQEGLIAATAIDRISLLDLPQLRHVANGGRPRKSTGWRSSDSKEKTGA